MKKIAQGAEAIIYKNKKNIIKHRVSKAYRNPKLDEQIIKRRTKAETKILEKISKIISVPKIEHIKKENQISMQYIKGKKLSQHLDKFPVKRQNQIMNLIGTSVAKIHKENIIHGDLTTSNMIYFNKEVYFIDFGLAFQNAKIEDKSVDIHLLKQALEAKHFKKWKELFDKFQKSYEKENPKEAKKIFERLKAIEKRGRYRH